jgi:hypothetical protein
VREWGVAYGEVNLDVVRWGLGHVLDEATEQGVFWDVVLVPEKIHRAWAWLGLGLGLRLGHVLDKAADSL